MDEANCAIGVAVALLDDGPEREMLARIQNELFDLGADLATPGEDFTPSDMALRITPGQVQRLEQEIDRMNEGLSPLTSFILPGGLPAAAEMPLNPQALAYVNRLSDHLFVLARLLNLAAGGDILWTPGATRG